VAGDLSVKRHKTKKGGRIMTSFTLSRMVDLPAEKVWEIAGNFTKSPGPGVLVEVEKQGDPDAHGVGAVRGWGRSLVYKLTGYLESAQVWARFAKKLFQYG